MNRLKNKRYFLLFYTIMAIVVLAIFAWYPANTLTSDIEGSISEVQETAGELPENQYWHLLRVLAYQAWDITEGNKDVTIAVLDTGIDSTHQALAGKVTANINFTSSPEVNDIHGHGTHIAGIIAGNIDQFGSIIGLAHGCSLMNVKIANDDGSIDTENVVEGIRWAVDNGANIINISFTLNQSLPEMEEAVNYAWEQGVIVIAAAGNSFIDYPAYPAVYTSAIAVAATDKQDHIARFSNYGDWVDVSAPGSSIYSLGLGNTWTVKNGTSMATAIVSAEAALLFSVAEDENDDGKVNDEVRRAIQNSCDILTEEGLEYRIVNTLKAINLLGRGMPAAPAN